MAEFQENNDEIAGLEQAFLAPAHDESFSEWTKNNPNNEYTLWLATRPDETREAEMKHRLRFAEYAPLWEIGKVAVLSSMFLSIDAYAVTETAKQPSFSNIFAMGILATINLVPFSICKSIIKHDLPKAKAFVNKERKLFEAGMRAISSK